MDHEANPQQMMEIEIKFAKGKVDYVIVHYGDDPITLAKEFVAKHNLKPSSVQIIAQYIESTVLDFIQTHQNEEKSNLESEGTNRQSDEKYEEPKRPSEDQKPPRKDKIERNRSGSEAPSANMSKDEYKSPPSVASNPRSVDNSSYFRDNSMPDRIPPTTPGMRKGERDQHDHAFSSKANSIRSIADDVSNDTTVPNNNLNRDALEQSQYGNISERSSFYQHGHPQTQSHTPHRPSSTNVMRSSPSVSQSLLDSSQALNKSSHPNPKYPSEEDDNNTIDKIVEKNLFVSEPTQSKTDESTKRPESKRKPSVNQSDEKSTRKEKIAEGEHSRYSTKQQPQPASRPTSYSRANREEGNDHNQQTNRNIRGQSVTVSDFIAQEEERKFFANAHDDEDDEGAADYVENPEDVHNFNSKYDVDEDPGPIEDGEGNIASYDDYTFRSDLDSLTKTDQNTLVTNPSAFNTDVGEHEDEDPEAKYNRLKYSTLKRSQTAVTVQTTRTSQTSQSLSAKMIKTTLKPATKSLQMGKQKLLSPQSQSQKLAHSKAEKDKLIGKTVNERLYYNAELMKKKKDLIILKTEEKKMAELENDKFRLNEGSQKIIETIQNRNHYGSNGDNNSQGTNTTDIGQKLYLEGVNALENKKKKLEKVNKLKENFIDSWSCVKCGTFHKVSASQNITNTPQMWGASSCDKYRCSNCCFNNQDSIESFKPTNVGLLLNEEMKENVEKNRKQQMNTSTNTSNIHDHLYQQGKQHEQMLALNRALWEDLNEKMSFKPNISEKSKAIIKAYQQQPSSSTQNSILGADSFDNDDVAKGSLLESIEEGDDEITSMQQKINNTKITGQNMKEYFSKPTFDRLISTNTRSFVDETIAFHNRNQLPPNLSAGRSTFATSKLSSKSGSEASTVNTLVSNLPNKAKQDQFVNRLVNEYKEKGQRMDERTKKFYAYDVNTGQQLWIPKIPTVPEEYGVKIISSSSSNNESKRDIWNDILRRDKELLEEKLKKQKDTIEKTLQELQKNQVKALPTSNEILQHSTQKNLEDLYKLLLVNTHPLNETIVSSTDDENNENDQNNDEEERSQSVKQPPRNAEEQFAFENPSQKKLRTDMLKNNNNNNNQDEAASNYSSFLQDNNTIVSEKQLNEVLTNYLTNWKEKKLDLLLIKPNLLINEISTLLLDMKYHVFNRWQSKQRLKLLNEKNEAAALAIAAKGGVGSSKSKVDEDEEYRDEGDDLENIQLPGENDDDDNNNNANILMTHPKELLISYDEFVKLAGKCIKKRSGPGKGYIFAPKKKADIAIQMKLEEYSEETFHPEIGKNSEAIIQKQRQQLLQQNQLQNNNQNNNNSEKIPNILPIEDILTEDGKRIQKKIEILRQEKLAKEEAQLTFKPFLYKAPSYVVPRYRGLDISEVENDDYNGLEEVEMGSNFSQRAGGGGGDDENLSGLSNIMGASSSYHHSHQDTALRSSHLSTASTAKVVLNSNNTIGSNTIFDIPNVTIGNRPASGAIIGGGGAIRGGGGASQSKNTSSNGNQTTNASTNAHPTTVPHASSKDTRSLGSVVSNVTNSDALSSPTSKGPINANELMTPPHVRQSRLLNQTNFPPPPVPPASASSSNNNNNNNNNSNAQRAPAAASEDTHDSKNSHPSQTNKDDSSIFTLTESNASIPGKTFEDSRTMSEKKRQLEKLNAKASNQYQQQQQQQNSSYSHQSNEKRLTSRKKSNGAGQVMRLDSSSLESYSPPMSLSSASQHEEGGRYSQMSTEFPSKFSAVSDVSQQQALQSSSELDDQRPPSNNKANGRAGAGGGYSKVPPSSINVRKPNVHPNAPAAASPALPPPLPGAGVVLGAPTSNQSIDSGYSGNLSSSVNSSSAPEGYSKQFVATHHPAVKGGGGVPNSKNGGAGGYLKASGMAKALPLLPHEAQRTLGPPPNGKGSSAAGEVQKRTEGRYSLDSDSYYSDENSTISTQSSTIIKRRL